MKPVMYPNEIYARAKHCANCGANSWKWREKALGKVGGHMCTQCKVTFKDREELDMAA